MAKRNKGQISPKEVPVVAAPVVAPVGTVVYVAGVNAKGLKAGYVQAAWAATLAALPATEAQLAALPEFKPELLKGGRVSGYVAYWVKTGRLAKQA